MPSTSTKVRLQPRNDVVTICIIFVAICVGLQEFPQTLKYCANMIKRWNDENVYNIQLVDDEKQLSFPKTKHGFKGDGDSKTLPSMTLTLPTETPSSILGVNPMIKSSHSSLFGSRPLSTSLTSNPMLTGRSSLTSIQSQSAQPGSLTAAIVTSSALVDSHDHPFALTDAVIISEITPVGTSRLSSSSNNGSTSNSLVVAPHAGFVIQALKAGGQQLLINVCHHESIGHCVRPISAQTPDGHELLPMVLSSMGLTSLIISNNRNVSNGDSSAKSLVMDVCTETAYYRHSSASDEGREEVRLKSYGCN
jgi:hypothetical protein